MFMGNSYINSPIVPLVLHRIIDKPRKSGSLFEDVEVGEFIKIINYCKDRGDFLQLSENFVEDKQVCKAQYLLTFDDGWSSDVDLALPEICKNEISAAFFLISDKIDTSGYMTGSQVRELVDAGMTLASHSKSHFDMTRLSLDLQIEELTYSKYALEDISGKSIRHFSFPYGKFTPKLARIALDIGYESVFTSRHGVAWGITNIFPRNSINGAMSWPQIQKVLDASRLTQCYWAIEDFAKTSLVSVIGDDRYRSLRDLILIHKER